MRRLLCLILLSITLMILPAFASNLEGLAQQVVPDKFEVIFSDGSHETRQLPEPIVTNGMSVRSMTTSDTYETLGKAMNQALNEANVLLVEPVYYMTLDAFEPDDVLAYDRWKFDATGATGIWQSIFDNYVAPDGQATSIIVAVLDDGITTTHPDLNVLPNGYDFADGDNNPNPAGTHGNHVAGIIGAKGNNTYGSTGIFPNVSLLPVKVFPNVGGGSTEYLDEAIDYAVAQGADVINMSLSYGGFSTPVYNALQRAKDAGVIIMASSGNYSSLWQEGDPYDEPFDSTNGSFAVMNFPAAHPTTVTVGSAQYVGGQVVISDFSSIAGTVSSGAYVVNAVVDVVGPGSRILSTQNSVINPTTEKSGTSMSSPFVAGLAALLRTEYPELGVTAIQNILTTTASTNVTVPTISGKTAQDIRGAGLVQVDQALHYYKPTNLTLTAKKGVDETALPLEFNPLTKTYTLVVDQVYDSLQIDVTGSAQTGLVTVDGVEAAGGTSAFLPLVIGDNTFLVAVQTTSDHVATYTIHVTIPDLTNASLKEITFTGSALVLTGDSTTHEILVPHDVTETTMTVVRDYSGASVTINGEALLSKNIPLPLGDTLVTVVLTSEDTTVTETHTLTFKRYASLSLNNLSIAYYDNNDQLLTTTSVDHTDFTQNALRLVRPDLATYATLTFDQTHALVPYTWAVGYPTPVSVVGKTQTLVFDALRTPVNMSVSDASATTTYALTFDSDSPVLKELNALNVTGKAISPAFDPGTLSYTVSVPFAHTTADVVAGVADPRLSITIDGELATNKTVALSPGDNTVSIVVTAPDASFVTTTLIITREVSANSHLQSLTFDQSALVFDGSTTTHTAKVRAGQTAIVITATPEDDSALVSINGVVGTSKTVALVDGPQDITILITAEDTTTTETHTLTLIKDDVLALGPLTLDFKDSGNQTLQSTTIAEGNFTGLSQALLTQFPQNAETVLITFDQSDYVIPYNATLTTTSGTQSFASPITFNLTALRHQMTYTLSDQTTSQAYVQVLDSDAALNTALLSLSVQSQSLSPAFAPQTLDYSIAVPNSQTTVLVNATANDPRINISINGTQTTSKTVDLSVGLNTVTILARPDATYYPGASSQTTTLTITRAEAAPAPGPAPGPAPVFIPPVAVIVPPSLDEVIESKDASGQSLATVKLSDQTVTDALKEKTVLLVADTKGLKTTGLALSLTSDSMKAIAAAKKDVVAQLGPVSLTLPQSFTSGLQGELTLTSKPVTVSKDVQTLGVVYEITMQVGGQSKTAFDVPLPLNLPFDPSKVVDAKKIAVFYYNEKTNTWEYVGGKVNANGVMEVKINHLSKYAVKEYNITFSDIKSHWAKDVIEIMASKKITNGVSATEFAPNEPLTNVQFIALLSRIVALPDKATNLPYQDIDTKAWYMTTLKNAYANGLLKNAYSNQLQPNEPIKREVMAKLLVNAYAKATGLDSSQMLIKEEITFKDAQGINTSFKRDVTLAYQLGLIKGTPDGFYHPQDGATRAEAMTVLDRLINLY